MFVCIVVDDNDQGQEYNEEGIEQYKEEYNNNKEESEQGEGEESSEGQGHEGKEEGGNNKEDINEENSDKEVFTIRRAVITTGIGDSLGLFVCIDGVGCC